MKSEALKEAQKLYRENHKEQNRRISYKATAKMYIKTAEINDLTELLDLIKERMKTKMEKYTVNGQEHEVALTQNAYLTGTNDKPYYEADAVDADGTHYTVRWEILDDYDPAEQEEAEACDWDCPSQLEEMK